MSDDDDDLFGWASRKPSPGEPCSRCGKRTSPDPRATACWWCADGENRLPADLLPKAGSRWVDRKERTSAVIDRIEDESGHQTVWFRRLKARGVTGVTPRAFLDDFAPAESFDGETFEEEHDGVRLGAQLEKVRDLMQDGAWRTLEEIAEKTAAPTHSISARLRDLRKLKFGGYEVKRRSRGERTRGLYEYRVTPKPAPQPEP